MDFRYFNQDTGKWESAIVGPEEFTPIVEQMADIQHRYGHHVKYRIVDWNTMIISSLCFGNSETLNHPPDFTGELLGEYIAFSDSWGILNLYGIYESQHVHYTRRKTNGAWSEWMRQLERRDMTSANITVPAQGIFPARTSLTESLTDVGGKLYEMTSSDPNGAAFYNTGIEATDVGVWELLYTGSPNSSSGGVGYRATNIGYVVVAMLYDFTNNNYYTTITYSEKFRTDSISGIHFIVDSYFISKDDTNVARSVTDPQNWVIRIQVSGFVGGVGNEGKNSTLTLKRIGR